MKNQYTVSYKTIIAMVDTGQCNTGANHVEKFNTYEEAKMYKDKLLEWNRMEMLECKEEPYLRVNIKIDHPKW